MNQGQMPSMLETIQNENVWANNGLLGDIRNTTYPENYYNVLDYKLSPETDTLKNCNTQSSLKGMGYSETESNCGIRVSIGGTTTKTELEKFVTVWSSFKKKT